MYIEVNPRFRKKRANRIKEQSQNIEDNREKMLSLKSKRGRSLFTEQDIDKMIEGLDKSANKLNYKAQRNKALANSLLESIGKTKIKDIR